MLKQLVMLKPIKTEKEYDNALAHIYELMQTDIVEGSETSDELEILSLLIKEYELVHYPMSYPNPIEAIKFRMEQMNLSENELSDLLGTRSRKSEVLSGKRKLSLSMIRKLTDTLHIPAEVLIQAY
ncbi:helix-turn-helix domain-containing protein [Pedobacter sp. NJ-S-72]